MVRKTKVRTVEALQHGTGTCEIHDIVSREELLGHGRMYAMVKIRPHSSIGYHQHIGETEQYFILQGHGIFHDTDGSQVTVGPGDVCYITVGQSHGIDNPTDEDLVLMALIYNERNRITE